MKNTEKVREVFENIDRLSAKYLSFWEDICNIESPTADKEGVDAVGEYVIKWAESLGFSAERHLEEVSGNAVCITMNEKAESRPISLSAHMDTVHPKGSFGCPAVRRDGDRLYGPGVTDCKGGIVAAALAMEALSACGFDSRPINLLLQSDEEISSRTSQKRTIGYICEKARGSEAFLNLEGFGAGKACVARKGILNLRFEVSGVEAHASHCARVGANAILEAAHKIIEMEKFKDHDGLTCTCSVISGGTVANTVAGYCEFLANIRFSNAEELEYAREYARRVADDVHVEGCSCKLVEVSLRVAMEKCDRNDDLLRRMNCIWSSLDMPILEPIRSNGGSDAADVTAAGIPCVDSLGVSGGKIHSPDEYANISSLVESAKRVASVAIML